MGMFGALGKAVGAIPGMKTMNKAMPGGGMPGVNQPKPQLGGGLGPSIKPIMNQGQKQMMNPAPMPQMPQQPPQNQGNGGFMNPAVFKGGGMNGGGMMGPSPMGMPPWLRGGMNGGMQRPQVMPNRPQNTGFARPFGGGMNNPNIQY